MNSSRCATVSASNERTGFRSIKESELPLESNRQGLMRWYMHPSITDTVLSTLCFFQQEIPPGSRSGRLKFQGGQVMLIIEGNGYTMVDGVKHAWEAGDVLNLPVRSDGIIVQHFNTDLRSRRNSSPPSRTGSRASVSIAAAASSSSRILPIIAGLSDGPRC